MSEFLNKVHQSVTRMGNAPYDDKKTRETISEITRKTVEYCATLPAISNNKFLSNYRKKG